MARVRSGQLRLHLQLKALHARCWERGMSDRSLSFGPFELFPRRRALLEGGKPLRLGSRALEVPIALVEQAGELLSNKDLLARAWPETFVEEANLRCVRKSPGKEDENEI
jgi:DNA-binding response OmpR family regulator